MKREKSVNNQIEIIKKEILFYKILPAFQKDLNASTNLKNLSKQLDEIKIKNIINNKNKNIIKDIKISSFILRKQILKDLPPKELRKIVDKSKNEIKEGIVVGFSIFEDKVGVAVGITKNLLKMYDAVFLVKIASAILGGSGGGEEKILPKRVVSDKNKIDSAFDELSKKIN